MTQEVGHAISRLHAHQLQDKINESWNRDMDVNIKGTVSTEKD